MKSLKYLLALAALTAGVTGFADEVTYSLSDPTAELTSTGFYNVDDYDVAIRITDPALVGKKVKGVKVPVVRSANVNGYKVWTETKLTAVKEGSVSIFTPTAPVDAEKANGYITGYFETPVEIPEGGLYVGYSFNVTKLSSTDDKKPIVAVAGVTNDGLYIHTKDRRPNWADLSGSYMFTSAIEAILDGEYATDDLQIVTSSRFVTVAEEMAPGTLTLANYGSNPVESVDLTVSYGSTSYPLHYNLSKKPIASRYGYPYQLDMLLNAEDEALSEDLTITLDKVNGNAPAHASSTTTQLLVCAYRPVNRPLMEEFTGTWCGGCPRGAAALKWMRDNRPNFIGVAFHGCQDVMNIGDQMPVQNVAGFDYPSSFINRLTQLDPYYGTRRGEAPFIQTDYSEFAQEFTPFDLDVEAYWEDAEKSSLVIEPMVKTVADVKGDFRLNYMVIADGLTGTGADWAQSNYFTDNPTISTYPELKDYATQPGKIYGYEYEDVVIFNAGVNGVENSLPSEFTALKEEKSQYKVAASQMVNQSGASLMQDDAKYYVVISVFEQPEVGDPVIRNSFKAPVEASASVSELIGGTGVREYYDLQGRKVAQPAQGLFIVKETLPNGQSRTRKAMLK